MLSGGEAGHTSCLLEPVCVSVMPYNYSAFCTQAWQASHLEQRGVAIQEYGNIMCKVDLQTEGSWDEAMKAEEENRRRRAPRVRIRAGP